VTSDGKPSPKNFPYWRSTVSMLMKDGYKVAQISMHGEPDIGASARFDGLRLREIEKMISKCSAWASVDNFFQHLAWSIGRPGVVIFGQSDPRIFGHPENFNLLKDRRYLRPQQWWLWSQTSYRDDVFVQPEKVVAAIKSLIVEIK
jgi:ADP-heptose:LPS heptosyltransferase